MQPDDLELFVENVKIELTAIDGLPIGEHAARLENVHRTLEAALTTIDGL